MANLVNRGINETDGVQHNPLTVALERQETTQGQANQDYEDFSTKLIAVDATRNATTKLLAASDMKETVTLADSDNWQVLEWDPQAEIIIIRADAAIDISTDPASSKAGAGGVPLAADTDFPVHISGSPNGRIYIKRNEATGQPVVTAYGYGSRKMAFSSFNAFNTASSQTA